MESEQLKARHEGFHTHSLDEKAREYLLVSVPKGSIGSDNTYPVPRPDGGLTAQMRSLYFINKDRVAAQVPRRSEELERVREDVQLEHVLEADGSIFAYYPLSETGAIEVEWDHSSDSWSAKEVTFEDGYMDTINSSSGIIWARSNGF